MKVTDRNIFLPFTMLAKINDICVYFKGGHAHHECKIVKSVEERKQLLRKYGRCFVCAHKGHVSRDCNSKLTCTICKGKHHVSIFYKSNSTNGGQSSHAHNGDCNGWLNSNCASNACLALPTPENPGGTMSYELGKQSLALPFTWELRGGLPCKLPKRL